MYIAAIIILSIFILWFVSAGAFKKKSASKTNTKSAIQHVYKDVSPQKKHSLEERVRRRKNALY